MINNYTMYKKHQLINTISFRQAKMKVYIFGGNVRNNMLCASNLGLIDYNVRIHISSIYPLYLLNHTLNNINVKTKHSHHTLNWKGAQQMNHVSSIRSGPNSSHLSITLTTHSTCFNKVGFCITIPICNQFRTNCLLLQRTTHTIAMLSVSNWQYLVRLGHS